MGAVVVRRHEEAAVHVGVAAGLEAQQPPQRRTSASPIAKTRRSATVCPGSAPAVRTIRNGSPPVW